MQTLFEIANSEYGEVVRYTSGREKNQPVVRVSWVRKTQNIPFRGLNFIESKLAYGYSIKKTDTQTFMNLVPLKNRPILLQHGPQHSYATIPLEGKESILRRVWVQTKRGFFRLPKVQYVDVFGIDAETGEDRHERWYP